MTSMILRALASAIGPRLMTGLTYLGGGVLGAAMLTASAGHGRGGEGEVIVHVTTPDVLVDVGGCIHRVAEVTGRPITCVLPAGEHELVVTRGDQCLQREPFQVPNDESVVLTAYEANRPGPVPGFDSLPPTADHARVR